MKLLLENWREYLKERIDYLPPQDNPVADAGDTFSRIDVYDIVLDSQEDTIRKIVLLDIFNQLQTEADESKIKNILVSMRQLSGNSKDFTFNSKEDALKFYKTPYKFKARPQDSTPTKSLRDYHRLLKAIESEDSISRSEEIDSFYS